MKLLVCVSLVVTLNSADSFIASSSLSSPRLPLQQAPPTWSGKRNVRRIHGLLHGHTLLSNEDSIVSFAVSNGQQKASQSPSPPSIDVIEHHSENFPVNAVKIYTDYASKLWKDTSFAARKRITKDKASDAVKGIKHAIQTGGFSQASDEAREQLMEACQTVLAEMESGTSVSLPAASDKVLVETTQQQPAVPQKKRGRSKLFGAMMGALAACWVFSGNYVFTGLFNLMTIISQLEFHRAVIKTGVYPARRIAILGACSMFLSALFAPELHQICLPVFGLWAMIWFLTMRRQVSTIPEIATTFTGMFYLGYVPSFWVRIRLIGAGQEPTRLAPLVGPILRQLNMKAEQALPSFIPKSIHLPITTGAVFIFWTWLSLAFSDVAAYFVGRKFGRTKLGKIAPAAGATSPNKTVEGVLGGCAISAILGVIGAWVQKWPYWWLTGSVHGIMLGLIGLIGDLTASMLKRDAGLKDFGDLIPEHGGILDRIDSYIWTAPYSWLVCAYIIPALRTLTKVGTGLPL